MAATPFPTFIARLRYLRKECKKRGYGRGFEKIAPGDGNEEAGDRTIRDEDFLRTYGLLEISRLWNGITPLWLDIERRFGESDWEHTAHFTLLPMNNDEDLHTAKC